MINKEKCKKCIKCGECCRHIRDNYKIEVKEEAILKGLAFKNYGIIYLYPFNKYTLSLTPEEAKIFKKRAGELNIIIKILPKKIIYNEKNKEEKNEFIVYDYFIDHNICPFLDKNNECLIYNDRPKVCKDFPNINPDTKELKDFIKNNNIPLPTATEKNYIKVLAKAHETFQK